MATRETAKRTGYKPGELVLPMEMMEECMELMGDVMLVQTKQFFGAANRCPHCGYADTHAVKGSFRKLGLVAWMRMYCPRCEKDFRFQNYDRAANSVHTEYAASVVLTGMQPQKIFEWLCFMGIVPASRQTHFKHQKAILPVLESAYKADIVEVQKEYLLHYQHMKSAGDLNYQAIEVAFDGAYSHRRNAGQARGCIQVARAQNTRGANQPPVIIAVRYVQKRFATSPSRQHNGASSTMESAIFAPLFDQFYKAAKQFCPGVKIVLCIDGDLDLLSMMAERWPDVQVVHDLSHMLKNVGNTVDKALKGLKNKSKIRDSLVKAVKTHMVFVIGWARKTGKKVDGEFMEIARGYFQACMNHWLDKHDDCLPTSECKKANFVHSAGISLKGQSKEFIEMFTSAIGTIWPTRYNPINRIGTNGIENANHVATRFHGKDTEYAKSYVARDMSSIAKINNGDLNRMQSARETLGLPPHRMTVVREWERLVHAKARSRERSMKEAEKKAATAQSKGRLNREEIVKQGSQGFIVYGGKYKSKKDEQREAAAAKAKVSGCRCKPVNAKSKKKSQCDPVVCPCALIGGCNKDLCKCCKDRLCDFAQTGSIVTDNRQFLRTKKTKKKPNRPRPLHRQDDLHRPCNQFPAPRNKV